MRNEHVHRVVEDLRVDSTVLGNPVVEDGAPPVHILLDTRSVIADSILPEVT